MHIHLPFFALLVIIGSFSPAEGENILFYSLVSGYSHRIAEWPLVEALAARGHNVTFLQLYAPKQPNPAVKEFMPKAFVTSESIAYQYLNIRIRDGPSGIQHESIHFCFETAKLCDAFLSDPQSIGFINSNKFDLVIIDSLFNECAYGLAHKWGAKTIVYFTSVPAGNWGIETAGFLGTSEPWITDMIMPSQMPMNFVERVFNLWILIKMHLMKEWIYYPQLDKSFKKLNVSNMPPVRDMLENTALAFYNSHFSEEESRSLPPKFVAVPALHIWDDKPAPLPKDMAKFIEESGDDGFIYVSFGSEAKIENSPIEFQRIFVNVFSQMKVRFLWKREAKAGEELPANVFIKDWMPQKDILASPKCKGFITHGGLMGGQEAIMNGVPMIAMPIFAEQEFNAYKIERTGRGIKIEAHGLTEQTLKTAIEELLQNHSYRRQVEKARDQLRDQLNTPLETAIFWTEYTLRNDMSTLQPSKVRNYYWFQANFLDVWAFFAFVVLSFIGAVLYIVTRLYLFYKSFTSVSKVKKS